MTPHTRNGFHRLAILAAAAAAAAVFIFLLLDLLAHGRGTTPISLVLFGLALFPAIAAGLAWLFIRGIAWVCDGFAQRRTHFRKPNWN